MVRHGLPGCVESRSDLVGLNRSRRERDDQQD